jgi:serpin B
MSKPRARGYDWVVLECLVLVLLCLAGYSLLRQEDRKIDTRIATAKTEFGFRLFGEVHRADPDHNVCVSPAGIEMALAMAYNGAAGDTRRAMASALGLEGVLLEDLNAAQQSMKAVLEHPDRGVQFLIANSLWARRNILFEPAFIRRTQEFYQAEVRNLDLDAPNAMPTINTWVSRSTHGRITRVVDSPLPHDSAFYLINAVAFKAPWTHAFPSEGTREEDFALPDGAKKKWPIMRRTDEFSYLRGEGFQAVELPYAGGRLSMYVFLPDEDSSLTTFCLSLEPENWDWWLSLFDAEEGTVALPRFRIEYEALLMEPLKALGMGAIFGDAADFSAMSPERPAWINQIKHKTYAEVDESGSRAAPARSGGVSGATRAHPDTFSMIVNRPFFFAIRDNMTGRLVFMGTVVDPA